MKYKRMKKENFENCKNLKYVVVVSPADSKQLKSYIFILGIN